MLGYVILQTSVRHLCVFVCSGDIKGMRGVGRSCSQGQDYLVLSIDVYQGVGMGKRPFCWLGENAPSVHQGPLLRYVIMQELRQSDMRLCVLEWRLKGGRETVKFRPDAEIIQ